MANGNKFRVLGTFVIAIVALMGPRAFAQSDDPVTLNPVEMQTASSIEAVTLYVGRASVTRSATMTLSPGAYTLVFSSLPAVMDASTLQARANGPCKVIGVEERVVETAAAVSPRVTELDARIVDLRRRLTEFQGQREAVVAQEALLAGIATRVTNDTARDMGSPDVNLEALRQQLAFVSDERQKLITRRLEILGQEQDTQRQLGVVEAERAAAAQTGSTVRTGQVTLVVTEASEITVLLTYLVSHATWQPVYNIRAMVDGDGVTVEYDALMTQRTGEDWSNVRLTLSTALPTVAATPPTLEPLFVDVQRPDHGVADSSPAVLSAEPRDLPARPPGGEFGGLGDDERDRAMLDRAMMDSAVAGSGPSVTFNLPRAVTVRTDSKTQQRTRIATIDGKAKFMHVAIPALTDRVYVRGNLTNSSAYQILAGPAAVFAGHDYIGPASLPAIAPGSPFDIHLGIDQSVTAQRMLVSKNTSNTGLLGGGRKTSYDYRIQIANGSGKPINLELWDRYPVSRHEDISVELTDLSAPLASDKRYVEEDQPRGLLKWMQTVPAGATGANMFNITYGVRINRSKDVHMTPLPE